MKFQAEASALKSVLQRATAVAESRTTIPILNHTMIHAADGYVSFRATDLDMEITENVAATVSAQGVTTAPAHTMNEIIKKLDNSALVTFELLGDDLHIKSGKSRFKLATLPAADYPKLASDTFQAVLEFDGQQLKQAIDRTVWAASSEQTRYYLNGIAMQHRDGHAALVSTDGHRLALYTIPCDEHFADIIIPTKTAKQFSSVIIDGIIEVHISDTKVKIISGCVEITSKCIDGVYPAWDRIIPKENNHNVSVSSTCLSQAVERVQVVMSEKTKIVGFSISDGELSLYAKSGSSGEASDSVPACVSGPDVTIGLNGKYALDAMRQADKGDVIISYTDNGSALLLKYEKEPSLTVVVMPARI